MNAYAAYPRYAKCTTDEGHLRYLVQQPAPMRKWHIVKHNPLLCVEGPEPDCEWHYDNGYDLINEGKWIRCDEHGAVLLPEQPQTALSEKQEASVVEVWQNLFPLGLKNKATTYWIQFPKKSEFVTAADHDRVVREKDATIAELRASQCKHPTAFACLNEAVEKLRTRAEAAEGR